MDLISRQDAIDALYGITAYKNQIPLFSAVFNIEKLPSVEPQIIRCKDCRWGREVCGNIECFADTNVPPEYHSYEWFCPNGELKGEKNECSD